MGQEAEDSLSLIGPFLYIYFIIFIVLHCHKDSRQIAHIEAVQSQK